MIWIFLVILWAVLAVVLCAGQVSVCHGTRVLGVAFPAEKARSPEVNRIVRTYRGGIAAVSVGTAAAGFLLLLPPAQDGAELWVLLLVIVDLVLSELVHSIARRRLLMLRMQRGWMPPLRRTASAELGVSRDKAKRVLPSAPVWVCLILSFAPAAFLIALPDLRVQFPLPFAFLGPLCQLATVALYYQMRNLPVRTKGEDPGAQAAFAQQYIRLQSVSAVIAAAGMLIFWLLFFLSLTVLRLPVLTLISALLMIAADIIAAYWQHHRMRRLEQAYDQVADDTDPTPEAEWKWGCYYNPADPRVFVPKPVESLGWTVNIGRPAGKAIMAGLAALVLSIVLVAVGMGFLGFSVNVTDAQLKLDAPFYDLAIERNQVESVELVRALPANGTRTNGYGGVSRSFGHFRFDGYGACMLYVYNNAEAFIQLNLAGDDPAYVFLNAETAGETGVLYEEIQQWLTAE